MSKEQPTIPQEIQNKGNEEPKLTKNADVNLENNDIQTESAVITGGESSHLSPDAPPKL
jgi:lipopolysaccharide export system protein LptC